MTYNIFCVQVTSDDDSDAETDIVTVDKKSSIPVAFIDHSYSKRDSASLSVGMQLDHDYNSFTHWNLPPCYPKSGVQPTMRALMQQTRISSRLRQKAEIKRRLTATAPPTPPHPPRSRRSPRSPRSPRSSRPCVPSPNKKNLKVPWTKINQFRPSKKVRTKRDVEEAIKEYMKLEDCAPDYVLVKLQDHNDKERERRRALRNLFEDLAQEVSIS